MKANCLVVRYGELFLKGKNRNYFIQKLVDNISLTFQQNNYYEFQIEKFSDQLVITTKSDSEKGVAFPLSLLKNVFGIDAFFLAARLEADLDKLYQFVENFFRHCTNNLDTFKFDIRRSDKSFSKDSLTLQKELGEIATKKYGWKVNLTNPQKVFYFRIYRHFILFFTERLSGLGGLPVGSSGKALLLLSGGIDSPVAAYQLMKRGLEITYLHFYQQLEGQEKITALVKRLSIYNNYHNDVYLVDSWPILTEVGHISQEKYRLIILKRMFIRLGCWLADELKIMAIATGDSLAQVASQTLESLAVLYSVSSLVIFWPLISWDKKEIIREAKKIGTYELSLLSYQDCCSLFEPKHPITKPRKKMVEKLEAEIFWEEVLKNVYRKIEFN
jgi:tRNA uracil 4-sulfurtransferase